jgi:hypothetical protein
MKRFSGKPPTTVVWDAIYLVGTSMIFVRDAGNASTLAHEWSHLLDHELKARTGQGNGSLRDDPEFQQIYTDVVAQLGTGNYYRSSLIEFFAQAAAGWLTNHVDWIADFCDPLVGGKPSPGPNTARVLAAMARLLPYTAPQAVPQRTTRALTVPQGQTETLVCGGVIT